MLRKLEIVLPSAAAQELRAFLADREPLAHWQVDALGERVVVHLLVETGRAEDMLDALENRFDSLEDFHVLLMRVHATVPKPPQPEETGEAEGAAGEEKAAEPVPERIARAELLGELESGCRLSRAFLAMVLLSTLVAAVGLVRDNVAVIIGAMVIAPLLMPNMALALAATLGDTRLSHKALRAQAAGVALALGTSVLLGVLLPFGPETHELVARTQTSYGDLVLALAAGAAGALAFTAGVGAGLVGVMVAVALLPPLVTAGLYLGSGDAGRALGALLLLATNVVCVNLAGIGVFYAQGLRPRTWWEADKARRATLVAAAFWGVLLIALLALLLLEFG